eukprot:TRINITY_DN25065_c0_g1_i2.p1 TRINITY_DN25065_c0_g1~~TRINITY_DN25065_c0_g1_i2.p1  ORF type:complete len:617 (-),score=88.47 TRINITY_DN25065_c0_g1_i2:225-2075(-)
MSGPAIGIDLGTTYSVVGVWSFEQDRVEILDVGLGERTLPSCVSFVGDKRLIGQRAVQQILVNAENTIFEVKRLMGRKYEDDVVKDYKRRFKVGVVKHQASGKPQFEVMFQGQLKRYFPEEISAMILGKLKNVAEEYLKCEINQAVITVPAYFNDIQRQATVDAGRIAGLQVLRILTEPTAAAIAYGMDEGDNLQDQKALVFDLGGGTFDVSLLQLQEEVLEVVATSGDTYLGGEDFKQKMIDHYLKKYRAQKNEDLQAYPFLFNQLPLQCERAKRMLSDQEEANVATNIGYFESEGIQKGLIGKYFQYKFTRQEFEGMNQKAFQKCIDLVQKTLFDAKVGKNEVKSVLLVGGSTRIPKIKGLITDFFGGQEKLCNTLNPDEAVAQGAAVQAAILQNAGCIAQAALLQDVTPLSLGIGIEGGRMAVVVPKNSPIPLSKQRTFTTTVDNQIAVRVKVYQGERSMVSENIVLGAFDVMVQKAEKGIPEVVVSFEINQNGILKVSAVDKSKDATKYLKIQADQYKISENQVKAMLEEANLMSLHDKEYERSVEQKLYLQECIEIKQQVVQQLKEDKQNQFMNILNDMQNWLQNNPSESAAVYQSKVRLLNDLFKDILFD